MDVLYYSNYCKYSSKTLQYITKYNLMGSMNFVCVDKRIKDIETNQTLIILENGKRVSLPPNIHSVPCLLQITNNYSTLSGDSIIEYLSKHVVPINIQSTSRDTISNGEPIGAVLSGYSQNSNIQSEQYTSYSNNLDTSFTVANHYVPATHNSGSIPTPDDKYKPDKLSSSVTLDVLQQKRNQDIPPVSVNPYPMGI
jgi:hypothetical protein